MENQPSMRALVVDNDTNVLRSSAMMLSDVLNFQVATCKSPARALRLIAGQKLKDVDVVLIDAVKGTTCGFDFRAVVEPHFCIPVIYYLPRDPHVGSSGKEADEQQQQLYTIAMRALPLMYTLKTPLDAGVLLDLPKLIELRKSYLQLLANGNKDDGGNLELPLPAAVQEILAASPSVEDVEEEDEHVNFKAARAEGRGQKRKGSSNLAADGSSGSGTAVGGQLTTKRLEHIKRQERMNLREGQRGDGGVAASHQQKGVKKAAKKNNGGLGSKFQQTYAMDVVGGNAVPVTCACAKTAAARTAAAAAAAAAATAEPAQATSSPHTVCSPPPAAAQAPPPVNPTPLPAPVPELPPAVHQLQQQPVMGSMAPPVADQQDICLEDQPGSTTDNATTTTYDADTEGLDILNEFLAMGTSYFPDI